jgi:DNA-binding HxlR family transcriptional regulator
MKELRTTYPWQAPYNAAISEKDDSRIPVRIYKAVTAIEQRLRSPVGSEEEWALKKAQAISTLAAERDKSDQFR